MKSRMCLIALRILVLIVYCDGSHSQCPPEECSYDDLNLPEGVEVDDVPQDCYINGHKANFTCQGELILVGPPYNDCQNGTWKYSSNPICEDQQLCIPFEITNGGSSPGTNENGDGEYKPHDTINYNCGAGFASLGPTSATCFLEGKWSPPTLPMCIVACSAPPDGINGDYTSESEEYTTGATVQFICHTGHRSGDYLFRTCGSDGTWSPSSSPICVDIDECSTGSHDCLPEVEICTNVVGSYSCSCAEGFLTVADGCSEEVILQCLDDGFRVSIYSGSLSPGTSASDVALLGNQSCRAREQDGYFIVESGYNSCGTDVKVTSQSVKYWNVIVDADDAKLNAGEKILIPVTCAFAKEGEIVPRSHLDDYVLSGTVSQTDDRAKFDFLAFLDENFILPLPRAESPLTFDETHFFEIRSEYRGAVEVGIQYCWASADNDGGGMAALLVQDGCSVDTTVVTIMPVENPAVFRFSVTPSLTSSIGSLKATIHCDVLACELDDPQSACKSNCGGGARRRRSPRGLVHGARLAVGKTAS